MDSELVSAVSTWHCALTVTVYSVLGLKPVMVYSFSGYGTVALYKDPPLDTDQEILYSSPQEAWDSKH